MARLARIVVPGLPHHITQRGNRREAIFLEDGDQEIYLNLLTEQTTKAGVAILAYCLMPNHAHLILEPASVIAQNPPTEALRFRQVLWRLLDSTTAYRAR